MRSFTFSLQKILDLREFQKKQAQVELGKAVSEESRIQKNLEQIAKSRVETVKAADKMFSLTDLYNANVYLTFLDQKKEKNLVDLAQVSAIADEKREIMREAMKKCKALENLKERRKQAWQREYNLEEENAIDEIVTGKFGNKV
ncbi:MAG: flagellar export protein FliJ [Treponema sp.]|nr:flagellar export protein FliJ [Treponema sp.]